MSREPIDRAAAIVGGPAALGRIIGITSQAISQWDRCPADRVIAVETATGGKVTREQLRPDLYPPRASENPAPTAAPSEAAP